MTLPLIIGCVMGAAYIGLGVAILDGWCITVGILLLTFCGLMLLY